MTNEALQWIALGIALTSKQNCEKVRDIPYDAFSWNEDGEARQLRNVLGQKIDMRKWFARYKVIPGPNEALYEAIIRVLKEDMEKRKHAKLAGLLKHKALTLDPDKFVNEVKRMAEELANNHNKKGEGGI